MKFALLSWLMNLHKYMSNIFRKFAQETYRGCILNYESAGVELLKQLKNIASMLIEKQNPNLNRDVLKTIDKVHDAFANYCRKLQDSKDKNVFNESNKIVLELVQFYRNPKLYENVSSETKDVCFSNIQQVYPKYKKSFEECLKNF